MIPTFTLPDALEAAEPPEARGLARDEVRLLVSTPAGLTHARFRDLPRFLDPGDLVVVNTSATLPAAVDGDGVVVHFAGPARTGTRWVVELRGPSGPVLDASPRTVIGLPGGVVLRLVEPLDDRTRLWAADVEVEGPVEAWLDRHGRPITYSYLRGRWPLGDYQPVFAREPGSAEMPSAGRPFTDRMVTDLVTAGVAVAPILLHTGVSSQEAGEPPQPERFRVPEATRRQVELAKRTGGRVIAVGTTVVRALETPTGGGWTDVVLGPDRPARVVDGLVTGWHAPEASHLSLLEAVAGPELVWAAYRAALENRYRWHEFGDSCLLLPT